MVEQNGMTMVSKILNDVKDYYKKDVVIDTMYPIDKDTKSFKIGEIEIEDKTYITYVRLNEYDDFVRIIHINIRTVKTEDFKKMNERNVGNEKSYRSTRF